MKIDLIFAVSFFVLSILNAMAQAPVAWWANAVLSALGFTHLRLYVKD